MLRSACLLVLAFYMLLSSTFAFSHNVGNVVSRQGRKNLSMTAKIVLDPLPKVYVYDHCPFCVRVRVAFGLKNIKHDLMFMANDDVPTPTALVGKKIAPIYLMDGEAMAESMDIIAKVDADPRFGPTGFFKPASTRTDIKNWQKKVKATNSLHQRSRYMMVPLPEFHMQDGKEAFVKKHPIPPYGKPEWAELTQEVRWEKFEGAYKESLKMLDETSAALMELDSMIHSHECCTKGGVSYDDIDLWARLRSLTVVKGLVWPAKLRRYMDHFAKVGDCPLYDSMAC